jgi:hypothetical protein
LKSRSAAGKENQSPEAMESSRVTNGASYSPAAERGLVVSLNQPGGNVTGIDLLTATNEPKRLGLVRDLVPHAATVGFLLNSKLGGLRHQCFRA